MALEKELATYARELRNLLVSAGKFALIHEESVAGVWDTYGDALQEGYRLFGFEPFMVKKVEPVETIHYIPRDSFPRSQLAKLV